MFVLDYKEVLLTNLDKVHTTEMGLDRIKNNLNLAMDDVVSWCKEKISSADCQVIRRGKNWYAEVGNCIITVNAYSYTIITTYQVKN